MKLSFIFVFNIIHRLRFKFFNKKSVVGGIFLLLFSFCLNNGEAQTLPPNPYIAPPSINELWAVREKFEYSVHYGFIKIGTISIKLMADTMYNGCLCHFLRADIRSNPDLPFVGHREKIYNSLMMKNDTVPYTVLYWTNDVAKRITEEDICRLDYVDGKVYTFEKCQPKDTLSLSKPSICGPVSLFYSRIYAGTNEKVAIPIYINRNRYKIVMDNQTKIHHISCHAFRKGRIKTFLSHGKANFAGPFGFNGNFEVWYADDSLRIPVAANLRVWLGNVKVRLVKYEITK